MVGLNTILADFENLEEIIKIKDEFQPGCDEGFILDIFKSIKFKPSEELIELYKWHNGMCNYFNGSIIDLFGSKIDNPYSGMDIFPMTTFLPLNISFTYYTAHTTAYKELFPFFSNDSILYINLDSSCRNYNRIYYENTELLIIEPMPIFNSISNMFFTLLNAFKEKVLYYEIEDDEWFLKKDYERYWNFGRKYNPGCEYWLIEDNDLFFSYKYDKDK